mgnify:CR=1 FL=1
MHRKVGQRIWGISVFVMVAVGWGKTGRIEWMGWNGMGGAGGEEGGRGHERNRIQNGHFALVKMFSVVNMCRSMSIKICAFHPFD